MRPRAWLIPGVVTIVLGAIFVVIGAVFDSVYALSAGTLGQWIGRHPKAVERQKYVSGGIFLVMGGAAAFWVVRMFPMAGYLVLLGVMAIVGSCLHKRRALGRLRSSESSAKYDSTTTTSGFACSSLRLATGS